MSVDGEYVTLAGLLLDRMGRLPAKGDRLEEAGLVFEVTDVSRHRIERVRITRSPVPAEAYGRPTPRENRGSGQDGPRFAHPPHPFGLMLPADCNRFLQGLCARRLSS